MKKLIKANPNDLDKVYAMGYDVSIGNLIVLSLFTRTKKNAPEGEELFFKIICIVIITNS